MAWTWERLRGYRWRRGLDAEPPRFPRRVAFAAAVVAAFVLGARFAASPGDAVSAAQEAADRLRQAETALKARVSEISLIRTELDRLDEIMRYSARHRIPADLASSIYDIALAEGIDPTIAFRLVEVESGFIPSAVSPVGAVGLAQLMPRTAYEMDRTLEYRDLFHRETNLHLGFRYLRLMTERYGGDLRLALLAYNRGPGTVDMIRRQGGDPENGYARAVLGQ